MSLHTLLPLLQAALGAILIPLVIKGHFRSMLHRLFTLYLIILTAWGLLIFAMRASPDLERAFFWEKFIVMLGPLMSVVFYQFVTHMTRKSLPKWFFPTLYATCVLVMLLSRTDLIVAGMQIAPFGYSAVGGPLFPIAALYPAALTVMAFLTLLGSVRKSEHNEDRNRNIYIMIGVGFALSGGIIDAACVLGLYSYPGMIIGNILFCVLTALAILIHNLLDIKIVIRKGIAYVLTSATIAIPFIALFLMVSFAFVAEHLSIWLYLIIAIILAFLISPLLRRVQQQVDKWFYRERYDYLKALEDFSWHTQSFSDLKNLYSTTVSLILGALRPKSIYLLQPKHPGKNFHIVVSFDEDFATRDFVLRSESPVFKWLRHNNQVLSCRELNFIPHLEAIVDKEKRIFQEIGAELIVPIKAHTDSLSGLLILGEKASEEPYTIEDRQLLVALGNHMAMTIENAQLYLTGQQEIAQRKKTERKLRKSRKQLQNLSAYSQLAREEERQSIAREIHDELGQTLTALKIDLSWLAKRLPQGQKQLNEKASEMSGIVDSTIQTIKKISSNLRPGVLDDLGVAAAIEWQAKEFQDRTAIKCRIDLVPDDLTLDAQLTTAIFRIFQEVLTNTYRHANATQVKVSLKRGADKLILRIRDNGKGITKEQITSPQSLGLIGMRERARICGGKFKIEGLDNEGTLVTVKIPLNETTRFRASQLGVRNI